MTLSRRGLRRAIIYTIGTLVAAVVALLTAGFVYQSIENERDLRAHPAPGQLVDIGGHRLHVAPFDDATGERLLLTVSH